MVVSPTRLSTDFLRALLLSPAPSQSSFGLLSFLLHLYTHPRII